MKSACLPAAALLLLGCTTNAGAIDVIVAADPSTGISSLETQGFAGRFAFADSLRGSFMPFGVTADAQYTWKVGDQGNGVTRLFRFQTFNTAAGGTTVSVDRPLQDIAVVDGQLYGVANGTNSVVVLRVADNGVTTPVYTASTTTSSGTRWRLSGSSGQLLVTRSSFSSSVPAGTTFAATRIRTSDFALTQSFVVQAPQQASPAITLPISDVVVPVNGQSATVVYSANVLQNIYDATGAIAGERAANQRYLGAMNNTSSAGLASDEFSYSYGADQPAVAQTRNELVTSYAADTIPLYRRPANISGTFTNRLLNGLAPDGVTVSDVSNVGFTRQTFGPTAIPFVVQTTPGAFAPVTIGVASANVSTNDLLPGYYRVDYSAANLQGTYTNLQTGASERHSIVNKSTIGGGSFAFAVEPVSENIIGNGSFSYSNAGWINGQGIFASLNLLAAAGVSEAKLVSTSPAPSASGTLKQILELNTADAPMLLNFDYRLDAFTSLSHLDVLLNDHLLGSLALSSPNTTTVHFESLVNDPTLFNLANAEFKLQLTQISGSTASLYVDNFSLVAVPEPGTALLSGIGLMPLFIRNRRRALQSHRSVRCPANAL